MPRALVFQVSLVPSMGPVPFPHPSTKAVSASGLGFCVRLTLDAGWFVVIGPSIQKPVSRLHYNILLHDASVEQTSHGTQVLLVCLPMIMVGLRICLPIGSSQASNNQIPPESISKHGSLYLETPKVLSLDSRPGLSRLTLDQVATNSPRCH